MPNHKFKELLDTCNGNTTSLKKEIAEYSGLSVRMIQLLYSGKQERLTSENALKFLKFFNDKRDDKLPPLTLNDIYVLRNGVDGNAFLNKINLTK